MTNIVGLFRNFAFCLYTFKRYNLLIKQELVQENCTKLVYNTYGYIYCTSISTNLTLPRNIGDRTVYQESREHSNIYIAYMKCSKVSKLN